MNMRLSGLGLLACLWLLCVHAQAATVPYRLHLNPGQFQAVDTTFFPGYAYNATSSYTARNAVIRVAPGDTLLLTLRNNDTVAHGFAIKGGTTSATVPAQDSITLAIPFPDPGLFIYYDPTDAPKYAYLGAAGMVLVQGPRGQGDFFWNVHEYQSTWNQDLMQGNTVPWNQYKPNYFTVNGLSHPHLDADSSAYIRGSVGDTLYIHVANTGRSVHSLHFHGFHVRVVYSSKTATHLNWIKDTMPIESMETLILELVPDKPGFYPTHDHNLLAVTGGSYYPFGLMLMMEIQ